MKRDLELIRKILIAIEENPKPQFQGELSVEGYDDETLMFHVSLLEESGFIDAVISKDGTGEIVNVFPNHLTWAGYEFLELARNNSVWEKSKKVLKEKSISVSVAILSELLKYLVKDTLGLGAAHSPPNQPV